MRFTEELGRQHRQFLYTLNQVPFLSACYLTVAYSSKLWNGCQYKSITDLVLILLASPLMFFFYKNLLQDTMLHLVITSLVFSNLWRFLSFPLSFMILTLLLSTGQVFRRMSLNWSLSPIFSCLDLGHEIWGRILQRWSVFLTSSCQEYTISIWLITDDVNLGHSVGWIILNVLNQQYYVTPILYSAWY